MRNTVSTKYIRDYIVTNYGELRHDPTKMVRAIRQTAKEYDLNKVSLFHYIIERTGDISGATSYGFDTRYGRAIRETFEFNYYNQ